MGIGRLTLILNRKERTEYKVKAMFELMLPNTHCRHVVLGCSHDRGYIPMLDKYKSYARTKDRITLLHTENSAQEYHALPFTTASFDLLLKSSSTPNGSLNPTKIPPSRGIKQESTPPKSPVDTSAYLPQPSGGFMSPRSSKDETKHQSRQGKHIYPRPIIVNKKQQRLDQELQSVDSEAALALDVRIRNSPVKPCNEFNFTGRCTLRGCIYDHQRPLPPAQCMAFAKRTREARCKVGSWCRNEMCIYGHMCQGDAKDYCSKGERCGLKMFHGMDTTPHQEIPLTESSLSLRD